jgi:hypothetical protein
MGWRPMAFLLGGVLMLAGTVRAADPEQRDLAIQIDNKPAGTYHLTIATAKDGTITVRARANVSYRVFFYHYTYTYQGTEVWKGGRLLRLDSSCNDDGKRYTVHAKADGRNLQVTINDNVTALSGDSWTTSAWHTPAARFRNHQLPMIDADTGRALHGRFEYVDQRNVNVNGAWVECAHYHIGGDNEMELYFDSHHRLVRQETVEQGHATVLQLTSVH